MADNTAAQHATQDAGSTRDDYASRRDRQLERCNWMIATQARNATTARWLYHVCQGLAILAGVAAPVLILALPAGGMETKVAQALVAATGSLFLGLLNQFGWRQDWVRQSTAAISMDSEKARFETRTGLYRTEDSEKALERFVDRVEAINNRELSTFVEQQQRVLPSAEDEANKARTNLLQRVGGKKKG